MTPRRSRRLLKALILTASAALLAAGIATAASRHAHHKTVKRHHAHAADVASVASAYTVLSREATAADAENTEIVGAARENDSGLRPAAARVLDTSASGRTWLIPTSRGELCVGEEPSGQYEALERKRGLEHLSFAYACDATATVEAQGIFLRLYDDVFGVVPDGVASVTVSIAGSAPERKAVVDNTYRLSLPADFQEGQVSFQDSDGVEQVERL